MSRSAFNLLLDTLLLTLFCALVWCAAIVRYIFPQAVEADGWRLWGLDYQQWANVQFGILAVLALAILLHVMLHWNWVCGIVSTKVFRSKKGKIDEGMQTIYGVGLLIVLVNIVGLAIAAAALSIRAPY